MASPPDFAVGQVLTAATMEKVGFWRVTSCTATFTGGTAGSASDGVITVGTNNTAVVVSNAFSADFLNYRIVYDGGTASTAGPLALQIGSATSGYHYAIVYNQFSASSPTGFATQTGSNFPDAGRMSANKNSLVVDVFAPFEAARTGMRIHGVDYATTGFMIHGGGMLNNTTSYSAFTISAASGNFSAGTIRVYGYRN